MLGRTMLGIVTTNHCILTMFVEPSNNMGQFLAKVWKFTFFMQIKVTELLPTAPLYSANNFEL